MRNDPNDLLEGLNGVIVSIRHDKAESIDDDNDIPADLARHLTDDGWEHIEGTARKLDQFVLGAPNAFMASPAIRCMQTVQGVARLTDTRLVIPVPALSYVMDTQGPELSEMLKIRGLPRPLNIFHSNPIASAELSEYGRASARGFVEMIRSRAPGFDVLYWSGHGPHMFQTLYELVKHHPYWERMIYQLAFGYGQGCWHEFRNGKVVDGAVIL